MLRYARIFASKHRACAEKAALEVHTPPLRSRGIPRAPLGLSGLSGLLCAFCVQGSPIVSGFQRFSKTNYLKNIGWLPADTSRGGKK